MQLIVLLSRAVYWGKIFFSRAVYWGKIFFVYVFPPGHAVWYLFYLFSGPVFGSPSQTVTVLMCMKMMIFTLGLNVHSSACKFNDFVMNNPDNCSFNHFFFFQYTFTNCSSLSCHSRLHSIPCYRYLELYCDFLIPARRDDLDPGRGEFPVHC